MKKIISSILIVSVTIFSVVWFTDEANAAVAFVQADTYVDGTDTTHDFSLFGGGTVTSGNILALYLSFPGNAGSITSLTQVSGTGTVTCTLVGTMVDFFSNGTGQLAWCNITGTGTATLRVVIANARGFRGSSHEISGVDTTNPLDQYALVAQVTSSNSTDAITTGNVTTTADGEYIFGVTVDDDGRFPTLAAGTNYTEAAGGVGDRNFTEYRTQTSAGSIAATFTQSVAATYYAENGMMTFFPTSGGGGDPVVAKEEYVIRFE